MNFFWKTISFWNLNHIFRNESKAARKIYQHNRFWETCSEKQIFTNAVFFWITSFASARICSKSVFVRHWEEVAVRQLIVVVGKETKVTFWSNSSTNGSWTRYCRRVENIFFSTQTQSWQTEKGGKIFSTWKMAFIFIDCDSFVLPSSMSHYHQKKSVVLSVTVCEHCIEHYTASRAFVLVLKHSHVFLFRNVQNLFHFACWQKNSPILSTRNWPTYF